MKRIVDVIEAVPVDIGGFSVQQPLPHSRLDHLDPFLLLHHAGPIRFEPGSRARDLGVGPHPHRGFEPVTFIYRGGVHHRDSRGNDSVISEGGVQWMTAGMGIIHSERPPSQLALDGGEQEIIQLWINLRSTDKMVQPRYQSANAERIPSAGSTNDGAVVRVVAGTFENVRGPIETMTPILSLNLSLQTGVRRALSITEDHNAFAYLLDGSCVFNNSEVVSGQHLVVFDPKGQDIVIEAKTETRLLIMSGQPLNEDVVSSGPFVMNSHTEILEAMRDYRMGKMGHLVEEFESLDSHSTGY